jgi:endonuclease III
VVQPRWDRDPFAAAVDTSARLEPRPPNTIAVELLLARLEQCFGVPQRPCSPDGLPLYPDLLDDLVGTILSQNTTDHNSSRAFRALKAAFPSWEAVLATDPAEVAQVSVLAAWPNSKQPAFGRFWLPLSSARDP